MGNAVQAYCEVDTKMAQEVFPKKYFPLNGRFLIANGSFALFNDFI